MARQLLLYLLAIITLASAAENLSITITIEKDQKTIKTEVIQLNNTKKSYIK